MSEIKTQIILGGSIKPVFTPATAKTKTFRFSVGVFKSGEGLKAHIHPNSEEVYYIIKGRGIVFEGKTKEETPVEQGMALYIPPGTIHGIVNSGTEVLSVAFFVSPGKDKTKVI